jgi:hypothetical protein
MAGTECASLCFLSGGSGDPRAASRPHSAGARPAPAMLPNRFWSHAFENVLCLAQSVEPAFFTKGLERGYSR